MHLEIPLQPPQTTDDPHPTKTPTPTLPTSTPTPTPTHLYINHNTSPKTNTDLIPESKQYENKSMKQSKQSKDKPKPGFWAKLFGKQAKRETTLLTELFSWLLRTRQLH